MFNEKDANLNHQKVNKAREDSGIHPLIRKKRSCLRCERKFLSESGNNRICLPCKQSVRRYFSD